MWTRQLAEHTCNHGWFQPDLASAHLSDRMEQRFRSLFLEHQPHGPAAHRLPMRLRVTHPRQDEYACRWRSAQEGRDTLHSIFLSQIEIEDNDIRLCTCGQRQRLSAIGCFANDSGP